MANENLNVVVSDSEYLDEAAQWKTMVEECNLMVAEIDAVLASISDSGISGGQLKENYITLKNQIALLAKEFPPIAQEMEDIFKNYQSEINAADGNVY